MNIILKKEVNEPQPAIDTICDNCGAIYDLLDCTTCACGDVLCPDCNYEADLHNKVVTEEKSLRSFEIIPIYNQHNNS